VLPEETTPAGDAKVNEQVENVRSQVENVGLEEAIAIVREKDPPVRRELVTALIKKSTSQESEEATEHRLQKFWPLLEPNPRSIKRFVIAYSMAREARWLQDIWVDRDSLALWTILQLRWPGLAEYLCKHPAHIQYVGKGDKLPDADKLRDLFDDRGVRELVNFEQGGPLDEKLITECRGVEYR
jgi:hypothetical protein